MFILSSNASKRFRNFSQSVELPGYYSLTTLTVREREKKVKQIHCDYEDEHHTFVTVSQTKKKISSVLEA